MNAHAIRVDGPVPIGFPESTFTEPRDDCPHPERWTSSDAQSTEFEVSELVAAFVRALQPELVVETGTFVGQTAEAIGRALRANLRGELVTIEREPDRAEFARQRCSGLPVSVVVADSLAFLPRLYDLIDHRGGVDFAWLDSDMDQRVREFELLRPHLHAGSVVGVHDTSPHQGMYGEHVETLPGTRSIRLRTPRGVTFVQLI